jgi:hypothetical protein
VLCVSNKSLYLTPGYSLLKTDAMRKLTLLIFMLSMIAIASCKKKNSSPSIVGVWSLSNVSGTSSYNLTASTGYTTTYTYSTSTGTLTETTTIPGTSSQTVSIYQLNTEVWTFNNKGAYTINEIYTNSPGSGNLADTSAVNGSWQYLSSAQPNDGVTLSGGISYILGNVASNTEYFTIQSLNGSTLELTYNSGQDNSGAISSTNVTFTFTR